MSTLSNRQLDELDSMTGDGTVHALVQEIQRLRDENSYKDTRLSTKRKSLHSLHLRYRGLRRRYHQMQKERDALKRYVPNWREVLGV